MDNLDYQGMLIFVSSLLAGVSVTCMLQSARIKRMRKLVVQLYKCKDMLYVSYYQMAKEHKVPSEQLQLMELYVNEYDKEVNEI